MSLTQVKSAYRIHPALKSYIKHVQKLSGGSLNPLINEGCVNTILISDFWLRPWDYGFSNQLVNF